MQDKYLTKEQMQTILDSRPKGVSMDSALNMYVNNGWTIQGVNEPKSTTEKVKDYALGFAKGAGRTALDVGQNLQTIGQGALLGLGASPESVAKTGFNTLDINSPQGKAAEEQLAAKNQEQKIGGYVEAGTEALLGGDAGLVKDAVVGGSKLLGKGLATASEALSPVVKKLTPDAESIMQRVARVSKGKQASFEKKAGESVGSFLDKRGYYGDIDQITESLYKGFQTAKQNADDALASLQGNYQPEPVKTALTKLKAYLKEVSSPGAVDPQLEEVTGLLAKLENQGLTMSEINRAKRLYERNVKLDFLKSNNTKGVTEANNIDNAVRAWQDLQAKKLGLTNLPEINKETMLHRELLDAIGKEYAGSAGNNAVSLTDWIILSGGDPTAVASFLAKQGLSSKKIQSFVAKLVSTNKEKMKVPSGEFTTPSVLPVGTYKDFLKATSKKSFNTGTVPK